ncbi:MAG: SDR family NAD(P)-dependent oxidoreductase [Proteobacteria bacterium]|nr:SDR family NAD(P)-dependent oxidoreductase [Pseudomonadota bacterium]MBU4297591.1 SDR family NAD(P)-dependent oxidoreductase [Pseudomonadota bacterium]MCG2750046.1 SDR family NAD(P)-dependent oxidoreductase [Desulfobulbaceae bacterium]
MTNMDAQGVGQKGFRRSDKRESRRINVNLDAKLCIAEQTYPVLIGNLSEIGFYIILPVPPGVSASLEGITDAEVQIRVNSTETLYLPCKKLWSAEIPDSPLVRRIGLLLKSPSDAYKKFYKSLSYQERTEITRGPIAVIGLACYYPGAPNLQRLWENIITRRRQFRRMPDVRLPLADYYDPDPAAEDKTYGTKAAVIDGFIFDWIKRGIPKSVVDSTDISHWLALETALQAVEDAGFSDGKVPPDRTGVILGNSLTGEQSRAEGLRLRWPFVLKTLQIAAADSGLPPEMIAALATNMEAYYKSVFAPVTEDTLAGGMSNTIAGRICNFLNLNGGGYTVDGACSSSLIAVATAATALSNGNMDLAIVGGVDVSLDTFELIGFAKSKALTRDDMRVYDRRANGFIPGEGAGFAVLKRLEDARANGDYIYAVLRGWGISTDGKGALTAPKAETQALAIRRAYTGAGYKFGDIDFVEGHGTGTPAGDRAELTAIAEVIGDRGNDSLRPCGVTSLKSIIGHTKAASGIGGFIKAVMAVNRRVLPPIANCTEPSRIFENPARMVYPISQGEIRLPGEILRAGVSGMGFGGINCHLTVESGDAPADRLAPTMEERKLLASSQETELFILGARTLSGLLERVQEIRQIAYGMSVGDLVDLAAQLSREIEDQALVRAALIADSPESLAEGLQELENSLMQKPPVAGEKSISPQQNVLIGHTLNQTRVGFLFPGQGSQQLNMARLLVERHEWARDLTAKASTWLKEENGIEVLDHMFKPLDRALDQSRIEAWAAELQETRIAQPAICLSALLWCKKLDRLGIVPVAAGGHSLGELTAFHAAGAFDEAALLKLAAMRGQAMTATSGERGAMASLACDFDTAAVILRQVQGYAVAANINSPQQLVISGEQAAVEQAVAIAREKGIDTRMLKVSNAFHSRFVNGAAERLRGAAPVPNLLGNPRMKLFSGIGGTEMKAGVQLRDHFAEQVISQVDFVSIVHAMARECDLLFEVGPAKVLSGLARQITGDQGPLCLPVESTPGRDRDLQLCLAHLFVQGGEINWQALYEDRLVRPFVPASARAFIVNPCEKPFNLSRPATLKTVPAVSNTLPATLSAATSIDPQVLSAYLVRRGPFLSAMIKADIENLPLDFQPQGAIAKIASIEVQGPQSSNRTEPTAKVEKVPDIEAASIADLLLELIEKQTGFPRNALSLELRLLDDLNLDSIKSAGLLAEAALRLGVAGDLDASQYANAPISEVVDTLGRLTAAQRKDSQPLLKKEATAGILFELIEKRTGFPRESLSDEMRLLDDLNLDSIKAAELLASAAQLLHVAGDMEVSQYANKTVAEIAAAFDGLIMAKGKSAAAEPKAPGKAAWPAWVRNFAVTYVKEALSLPETIKHARDRQGEKVLILCRAAERALAENLGEHFAGQGALSDVLEYEEALQNNQLAEQDYTTFIGIQPKMDSKDAIAKESLFLAVERLQIIASLACRAQGKGHIKKVVFIQFGGGFFGQGAKACGVEQSCSTALAASLHLEQPDLQVRVLDFDPLVDAAHLVDKVAAEMDTEGHYVASGYDSELTRRVPRFTLQEPAQYTPRGISWSADDVILVTGGAKGITAACALAFARQTRVRMALVGSSPHPDAEVGADRGQEIAQTLSRYKAAGLAANYYQCDIVDREAVQNLVRQVQEELGGITGVIHGGALNKPRTLDTVSTAEAFLEISPKVLGAVNLCEVLADQPPKLFIGFSSIIGVSGMARNGWYGFSNQALDLLLRRFAEEHPVTAVQSMAFSIWDEIGMGIRLGSVAHLAQKGIAAIPAQEGVRRFLQLASQDPGEQQVVVAARLANLDTIQSAPYALPRASRFLERLLSYTPDVEVVVRAHLNLMKDAYVLDHNWRGSLLFPTVFGLEAMAQAVAYVTGDSNFDSIRMENIRLERPIPVSPEKGIEIEIRAEVLERQPGELGRRVLVAIGAEQTGFSTPHFSATFVLGEERLAPVEEIVLPERPLDIDPKEDLYNGKLLFQGPRFQRLTEISSLDSKQCVFKSRPTAPQDHVSMNSNGETGRFWLLDDPYFRDSLLHAVQLSVSQHICLPLAIESIERFSGISHTDAPLTGIVRIEDRTDKEVHAVVTVVDDQGRIVERLNGYLLKILEYHAEYPLPEELAEPGPRDEDIIRRQLHKLAEQWQLALPEIALVNVSGLPGRTKEERHELELPVFQRAVRQLQNDSKKDSGQEIAVSWLSSGKPCLENAPDKGWDISLSHDHDTVLCVAGTGPQGCDLQAIAKRTSEEWVALLGKDREPLLEELLASGDSLDQAGTRIWAANEAFYKATGTPKGEVFIKKREEESVMFHMTSADFDRSLLTFPVLLTKGPRRVVAVVSQSAKKQQSPPLRPTAEHHARKLNFDLTSYRAEITDGPHKQPAFTFSFPVTFKEAANPSRTLYYSKYFDWIGNLREYMIQPIYKELVAWFATGKWGMVTNHVETRIFGEASAGDVIEGCLWLDPAFNIDKLTPEFCFEWRKRLPDGDRQLIASSRMGTSWVAIRGHGIVEIQPFPGFCREYLIKLMPQAFSGSAIHTPAEQNFARDLGAELYQEPKGPAQLTALLREEIFQTSQEDANLVGNIYFSHYYKWQGRTRDNFLREKLPAYSNGTGDKGEFRCTQCKVNHMAEAMPYDRIAVRMYRQEVYEKAIRFYFDYYRLSPEGERFKLGYGIHEAVWYAPHAKGAWRPAKLPPALLEAVIPGKVREYKSLNPAVQSRNIGKYDAIVVGAGIGGLTAASLLAKEGVNVVVVEQHNKPGGFCTSWGRQVNVTGHPWRYKFDAGVHEVFGLGPQGNVGRLLKELGIDNQIAWERVSHQYILPDFNIEVPENVAEYEALLCTTFPEEKEGIGLFFAEILACYSEVYDQTSNRSRVSRWLGIPFPQMVDAFIRDKRLKDILSVLAYYVTDDVTKVQSVTVIPVFGSYIEGGYYPRGGSQVLSDILANSVQKNGGSIILGKAVSRIKIENGGISGVVLSDGRELLSSVVVSNADIKRTFIELVGHQYLPANFFEIVKGLKPSNSAFMVTLGLDFIPDIKPVTMLVENGNYVGIMNPSIIDPTLAPAGHAALTLIRLVSQEQAAMWKTWQRDKTAYTARKKENGDELIGLAERAIPGLRNHIVYRQDASPATFARYAWTSDGAIYGTLIDTWKPPIRTPIRGLYLSSASISVRPGVADAVSAGMQAAKAIFMHMLEGLKN